MTGASWVTQADRARWQRQAARELAAILGAWGDLPLIMWAVGPAGGLAGSVTGPAPARDVRMVFTAWQRALAMDEVTETGVAGGTWLRARAWRGGVRVTVTATVPAGRGPAVTW